MWSTVLPIALSGVSLIISLVTLWRAHLAPFKIVTAAGPLSMRLHAMSSEQQTWQLPHFSISLGMTNSGSQIGRVLDIRCKVRYPSLPIPGAYEIFRCVGEFDPVKYDEHAGKRLLMMRMAKITALTSFTILPKTTVTKFLVFSTRWDTQVRQRSVEAEIELLTDRTSQWQSAREYGNTTSVQTAGLHWRMACKSEPICRTTEKQESCICTQKTCTSTHLIKNWKAGHRFPANQARK